MAGLTGKQIAESYKDLLQLDNSNGGLTATTRNVKDGNGTASPLQLSNSAVNINGTFQLNGATLTASASVLNAVADLTGANGIVAVSAGQVYGRTLIGGTGVSIGNADGTEGNPTFSVAASVATSADLDVVNDRITSVGTYVATVSSALATSIGNSNTNINANANAITSINSALGTSIATANDRITSVSNYAVALSATMATSISKHLPLAGGTLTGNLTGTNITLSGNVSAAAYWGDGSNLTGLQASIPASIPTSADLAAVNSRVTSVSDFAVALSSTLATSIDTVNTRVTSVSDFAVALSATMATSIANHLPLSGGTLTGDLSGTNITLSGNVSAAAYWGDGSNLSGITASIPASVVTSVQLAAANARITSVSDFAVALSATFATSINNSNTNIAAVSALTSVNLAAITSINTVIDNLDYATSAELAAVSSALATSISTANTRITSVSDFVVALSATFATSINNSNTNIATVSALTSVNLAAITSINTIINNLDYATSAELAAVSSALATSIANYLPLAGGTMTGQLIGTSATFSGAVCATDFYGDGSNLTGISAVVSVNDDVVTDATEYPVYVSATGTLSTLKTATTKMTFNPSKGTLTALQMAASNGILLNSSTVSISFDIPTGYNALSAGPITIDSGVTVTVPTSSTWTVI